MLAEIIKNQFQGGKLGNSYLIETNDIEAAAITLIEVAKQYIFKSAPEIDHPDLKIIFSESGKEIVIDQVRYIQRFLSRTSIISDNKIVIIKGAEMMNINAANACLKILEDTPTGAHIFLLTNLVGRIIPTIRSRCEIIKSLTLNNSLNSKLYDELFIAEDYLVKRLNFIQNLNNSDQNGWLEFTNYLLSILNGATKNKINDTAKNDCLVLQIFKDFSIDELLKKYEEVSKIVQDTVNLDLNYKASAIILFDIMSNK